VLLVQRGAEELPLQQLTQQQLLMLMEAARQEGLGTQRL
jgi:hypothetical protein